MPGEAPALLQVRALSKSFGGVVANDALSFDVPEGAIVGLIGPNGSGKTTLFNCLTAQVRPDSGTLSFAGRDLRKLDTAGIARLGLVRTFQQAHVYGGLTCLQNLEISAAQAGETLGAMLGRPGAAAARKAHELLQFVGLEGRDAAAAGKLSYGERKLLELAMALMSEPKMLLLDEPTAGVNPALVQSMVERLQLVNRTRGLTLLVIEHNMRAVMELAQQIHCLARGRLLASGTPDEIRADPRVLEAYLGTA
ncbi:MAG TPA: ABC transporter ATP-binding protein [Burkholderiales bacterium]|nr:ABC transporter ATP-binding protein [Burkholderiales bacterium]